MRVEVWSDVICAWCGIGNHRLKAALDGYPHRDQVEVVRRHFELDPSFPVGEAVENDQMLRTRGIPASQVRDMLTSVERLARREGLTPYRVLHSPIGNTHLAHELLAFADDHNAGARAWQALYDACFEDGRPFFDIDSLGEIAAKLGLDKKAATDALRTHRYANRLRRDRQDAARLGATGVPFYLVDRKYAIAGAQPTDVLVQVLERARRETQRDGALIPTGGATCDTAIGLCR